MKLRREIKRGWFWDVDLSDGSVVSAPCPADQTLTEEFLDVELGLDSFREVRSVARIEAVGCRHVVVVSDPRDNCLLDQSWNTFGDAREAREALFQDEDDLRDRGVEVEVVEDVQDSPGLNYLRRRKLLASRFPGVVIKPLSPEDLPRAVDSDTLCDGCGAELSPGGCCYRVGGSKVCGNCRDVLFERSSATKSVKAALEDLEGLDEELRMALVDLVKERVEAGDSQDRIYGSGAWELTPDDALLAERMLDRGLRPGDVLMGIRVASVSAEVTKLVVVE